MKNLSPPGARGSGFIVPSSEPGPSDQTDIDWMVILDPLGRWRVILEESNPLAPFGLRFLPVVSGIF